MSSRVTYSQQHLANLNRIHLIAVETFQQENPFKYLFRFIHMSTSKMLHQTFIQHIIQSLCPLVPIIKTTAHTKRSRVSADNTYIRLIYRLKYGDVAQPMLVRGPPECGLNLNVDLQPTSIHD